MARCRGQTRAGRPCSITATCSLTDERGRLAAEPLKRGGEYCLFHAKPFVVRPAAVETARSAIIVFLDLETTGVDVARDRVVELAAMRAPEDSRSSLGGSFCTVVRVDPAILRERGGAAAAVHGIADEEIAQGPCFPEAWRRFLDWTDFLLNTAVTESEPDTDDDDPHLPRLPDEPPILLLAAHNGVRASEA